MKQKLKEVLKNMVPKRNLKWFWINHIKHIRSDQECSYGYFNLMMNEFHVIWPEIETKIQEFINENK